MKPNRSEVNNDCDFKNEVPVIISDEHTETGETGESLFFCGAWQSKVDGCVLFMQLWQALSGLLMAAGPRHLLHHKLKWLRLVPLPKQKHEPEKKKEVQLLGLGLGQKLEAISLMKRNLWFDWFIWMCRLLSSANQQQAFVSMIHWGYWLCCCSNNDF